MQLQREEYEDLAFDDEIVHHKEEIKPQSSVFHHHRRQTESKPKDENGRQSTPFSRKSSSHSKVGGSRGSETKEGKKRTEKESRPQRPNQPTPRHANMRDLERLLQQEQEKKLREKEEKRKELAGEGLLRVERDRRYRVSRSLAAPVERVLRHFGLDVRNPSSSSSITSVPNLYRLFDIPSPFDSATSFLLSQLIHGREKARSVDHTPVDVIELKKKYRQLALLIHPDKNPHPDAKEAFDLLQDAYSTLTDAESRRSYHSELQRQCTMRYHWTAKKSKRWLSDRLSNLKSQLLLTYSQWRSSQAVELLGDWRAWARQGSEEVKEVLIHFALLPTIHDRYALMNEMLWRHRYRIVLTSFFLHFLLLR